MFHTISLMFYTLTVDFFGLTINIGEMAKSLESIIYWGFNIQPPQGMAAGSGINIWNLGQSLYDIVTVVAGSLLVLFIMLEFVSMCTKTGDVSSITWERIVLLCCKYFMIYALFKAAPFLLQTIADVTINVFQSFTSASLTGGTTVNVADAIKQSFEGANIIEEALMCVVYVMAGAAYLGTAVAAIAGVFQRAIKLVMYYGVSPVPIAMLAYHETSHAGKRFIMGYAAALFEGIFILLVIKIYSYGLSMVSSPSGSIDSVLGVAATISLMNAVLTGGISLSSQVAKETIG